MQDKINRLVHMNKNSIILEDGNDESIKDTLYDLANYSLMAAMLLD